MTLRQFQGSHYGHANPFHWFTAKPPKRSNMDTLNIKIMQAALKDKKNTKVIPPEHLQQTHSSLRGGSYHVEYDLNDDFLWHNAVSIGLGMPPYLIENRTEFFKFHLDFDYEQLTMVTLDTMRDHVLILQTVLRRYFPRAHNTFFESLLSTATPKNTKASDGVTDLIKTGYHIIFPHLWVHGDQALAIRADFITALRKEYGVRKEPEENDWEMVVDEHIFTTR